MSLPESDQADTIPEPVTADYFHTMRRIWGRERHRALWTEAGLPADLAYVYYGITADNRWHVIAIRGLYEFALQEVGPEARRPEFWLEDARVTAEELGLPLIDLDRRLFNARGLSALNIEDGELEAIVAENAPYLRRPAAEE